MTPTREERCRLVTLTPALLEILQHALGMDKYGQREKYSDRNHFCAGGTDVPDCAELVAIGYMRSWRSQHYPYFNCMVTEKGIEAARQESPAPPKLTRSQRRYRRFMDHDSGLSFGEWLKYYGGSR